MPDQENPPQGPPSPPSDASLPPWGDGGKNLVPINIEDEMRRSYLDYAMSVIVGRALPDVRDGLKPVHRRILYACREMGLVFNRAYRKCAGIVGEVLGNYHPHGDASVYDALVRMAQDFSMRYPLVDGQGNFGSVDGDPPAAYRYTEARLSRIDSALLEDLDKETVDFRPNFDERRVEPEVLPTRVPNLLINGSSGIAVGMATNIPSHNLSEIISATILMVQKPDTPLEEILKIVQGPDFATGGLILGRQGILDYFTKGRGTLKVRAKAATEKFGKDRDAIIVTEIPYQVNKARLIEAAAALVNDKKIEGISEIRDESDRDGMRIVFELKRGEQPEVILNNLYKHTQLQVNFGVIMLSIVNGQPRELGLIELKYFIDHRVEVVRRRTELRVAQGARTRTPVARLQEGAGDAGRGDQAHPRRRRLPRKRARGLIAPVRIYRETGAGHHRIATAAPDRHGASRKSWTNWPKSSAGSRSISKFWAPKKNCAALIIDELREVQKEFGDERRTQIVDDMGEIRLEDLVAVEDVAVTVTHGGYLKRTAVDTYRRQSRGGKGRIGMGTRAEDFLDHLIIASTHSYLLIFTNKGRVYWLKVYEIPDASTSGKGKHISNLISLQPDETVKAFLTVREFTPDQYIVMVTKHGVIKKSELTEFDNPMARGIIAVGLDEEDELIAAKLSNGKDFIFLGRTTARALRFQEDRRASDGPAGSRRARHEPGGGRLPGGHGSGGRRRQPDPLHLRARLRQAYAAA